LVLFQWLTIALGNIGYPLLFSVSSFPTTQTIWSEILRTPCAQLYVYDCHVLPLRTTLWIFSSCKFDDHFGPSVEAFSLITAQLVLLIRVSALYDHSKIWLSFLLCLFTCQFAAVIVGTVIKINMQTFILDYQFMPGCWVEYPTTESNTRWTYPWWIPFMCFDGQHSIDSHAGQSLLLQG